MVSSLDGYIAKKNNSVLWFETSDNYEKGVIVTEQDAEAFLKKIDCYIMGFRTYELALNSQNLMAGLTATYQLLYKLTETCRLTGRVLKFIRATWINW